MTQRELAGLAKTSQQQIARVEQGQQARLDLAFRICSALGQPIESVFPKSRRAVKAIAKSTADELVDEGLNAGPIASALSEAGLEVDPRDWFVRLRLTGGAELLFALTNKERRRLHGLLANSTSDEFIVFDTLDRRVLIANRHLEFAHIMFEVGGLDTLEGGTPRETALHKQAWAGDHAEHVVVHFADEARAWTFEVDPDEWDSEDDSIGQLGSVFIEAENSIDDSHQRFYFEDVDGEDVFLLASRVAALSAPMWKINKEVYESYTAGWDVEPPERIADAGSNQVL